ncbi:hypothetical protein [Maricaulis sp.]|uniref:hypothetical protein n=1 Tax=Maricaulis sp. TaxID=1486257 RepID=UPI003A9161EB
MHKIEVMPTDKVSGAAEIVRARLPKIVDQNSKTVFLRKAAIDLPQFLHLMGSFETWVSLGLGVYATAFLARLGQVSADKLVRQLERKADQGQDAAFVALIDALALARNSEATSFTPVLDVEFDDGTELKLFLESPDQGKTAIALAKFFANLEAISTSLRDALASSKERSLYVIAKLHEDDSLRLEWHEDGKGRVELSF